MGMKATVTSLAIRICLLGLLTTPSAAGVGGGPFVSGMLRGTAGSETITDAVLLTSGDIAVCGWVDTKQAWDDAPGLQQIDRGGTEAFVAIVKSDLSTTVAFTLLGGASDDKATAIAVSSDGRLFVVGTTESPNFPTTSSTIDPIYNANVDGFLACLNDDLTKIEFATYIGGSGFDIPHDIVLDAGGSIYICGETTSGSGFPNNNGLFKTIVGNSDAFVMRLSPNAATVNFSTYFGGTSHDSFNALVLDNSGTIVLTGTTSSADFPMYPAIDNQWWWYYKERPYDWTYNEGDADAILTVLSQDGARAISSTYFGGQGMDEGVGVALIEGTIYVLGSTSSADMPTLSGLQMTPGGKSDIFLASFKDNGRTLTSCTYFGGSGNDYATSLSVYRKNSLLAVGNTTSNDFPARGYLATGTIQGGSDGIVFLGTTSSLAFSTTLGGSLNENLLTGLPLDNGGIIVAGASTSPTIKLSNEELVNNGKSPATDAVALKVERGGIDLGQPYGGERLCEGSTLRFAWVQTEMESTDKFEIQYSSDRTQWTTIAKGISGTKYEWKVGTPVELNNRYFFRVVSERGHASETQTALQLDAKPQVVQQPTASAFICPGEQTVLRAQILGTDVSYVWLRDNVELSGENADTLVLTSSSKPGSYALRYNAACGFSETTSRCTVELGQTTQITAQPLGDSVLEGRSFSLSVSTKGSKNTYQWYLNNIPLPLATSPTYEVANAELNQSGSYRCTITGACNTVSTIPVDVLVSRSTNVTEQTTIAGSSFPNPATNAAILVLPEPLAKPQSVVAYNTIGIKVGVWDFLPNAVQQQINLSALPGGLYQFIATGDKPYRWQILIVR